MSCRKNALRFYLIYLENLRLFHKDKYLQRIILHKYVHRLSADQRKFIICDRRSLKIIYALWFRINFVVFSIRYRQWFRLRWGEDSWCGLGCGVACLTWLVVNFSLAIKHVHMKAFLRNSFALMQKKEILFFKYTQHSILIRVYKITSIHKFYRLVEYVPLLFWN